MLGRLHAGELLLGSIFHPQIFGSFPEPLDNTSANRYNDKEIMGEGRCAGC